jgi:hypothetical protein
MSEEREIFMERCVKVVMSFVLVVVCFSFAFAGTASAHTSTPAGVKNGAPVVIQNVTCCGEDDTALRAVQLFPQTSGSITNSYTISNSFSANVGVDVKAVSASVGFSVSQSYTITADCSANNTTNQLQTLSYYAIYTVYDFELWQAGKKVGVGSANRYNYDQCFYSAAVSGGGIINSD